jgi:hypothetical protein
MLFLGMLWVNKARVVEADVAAPPNDVCASAAVITAVPAMFAVVTSAATTEPGDPRPACGNGSSGKSVWCRFTSPTSGAITADTFNSDYDTILSVYTGSCGNLAAVPDGCNDDDPRDGAQSKVSFQAAAGTTYYFMVSASNNDGGNLAFHLTSLSAPSTATPTATPTPALSATPAAGHLAPAVAMIIGVLALGALVALALLLRGSSRRPRGGSGQ